MSDSVQVSIVIGAAVLAVVLVVLLVRLLWLRRVRRLTVRLFGRAEAVESALRHLGDLLENLADGDHEVWERFVSDADSEDRRALAELGHRMDVVAVDLASTPLPKVLWNLAEELEDIAAAIHTDAARVGEGDSPTEVVDALGAVDLKGARARYEKAAAEVQRLIKAYGVKEPAVYGGGFHI